MRQLKTFKGKPIASLSKKELRAALEDLAQDYYAVNVKLLAFINVKVRNNTLDDETAADLKRIQAVFLESTANQEIHL